MKEVSSDFDPIVPKKFTKWKLYFQSVKVRRDEVLFVRKLLCLLLCDLRHLGVS